MSEMDLSMAAEQQLLVSVVVIGRNEGPRLLACLDSIAGMSLDAHTIEVIYVDSDSTDGSPEMAAARGANVIRVKPERPSAALGRNAGWRAARGEFILFLDGDTQLNPEFVAHALAAFDAADVAIVWGHRRESNPEQSFYVRVLDLDWIYPPGDTEFCGGDALVRRSVLDAVNGFDESLIAGEEPEMCRRIRADGGRIVHLDVPMTKHDLAISRFSAYWRRAFRAGHAYAEVAARFRDSEDPFWRRDVQRNWLHGGGLLLGSLCWFALLLQASPPSFAVAALMSLAGFAVIARSTLRNAWKSDNLTTRVLYALHSHFQQIPILCGQLSQRRDARRGRQRRLIEYKD
ncbi:glycosyltransferase [Propionivibrio sp.]|uniref:glycosyltransferase n=1 Tax=Propionivibrio sp. TaxID=2212460 RepID=UPI003BF109B2